MLFVQRDGAYGERMLTPMTTVMIDVVLHFVTSMHWAEWTFSDFKKS